MLIAAFTTSDRVHPREPILMIARFSSVRGSLLEFEFPAFEWKHWDQHEYFCSRGCSLSSPSRGVRDIPQPRCPRCASLCCGRWAVLAAASFALLLRRFPVGLAHSDTASFHRLSSQNLGKVQHPPHFDPYQQRHRRTGSRSCRAVARGLPFPNSSARSCGPPLQQERIVFLVS